MAADTRHLLETDRQFAAASLEQGSADAFYTYLRDDAVELLENGAPLEGRKLIREHLQTLGMHVMSWTPRQAEVSASRDLGWTWGDWRLLASARSGEVLSSGKYMNLWKYGADGAWKVAVAMGNTAAPRTPEDLPDAAPDGAASEAPAGH